MSNNNLKPCPVCGAKAFKWHWTDGAAVQCDKYDRNKHNVRVVADTEEEAVRLWDDLKDTDFNRD